MTLENLIQNYFNTEFKHFNTDFNIFLLKASSRKEVHHLPDVIHKWNGKKLHRITLTKQINDNEISMPGVYVFWNNGEVLRVGRSLTNTRKRAMDYYDKSVQFRNELLKDNKNLRLMLLNVKTKKLLHWAAALEIYFEDNLNPKIKAKHRGK